MNAAAITVSPQPIPFPTTRFLCPYCRRGRSTEKAVRLHMPKCWRNPALHGCKTCVFFQTSTWAAKPGYAKAPGRCKVGYNLAPGLVTQCRKWKAKPEA